MRLPPGFRGRLLEHAPLARRTTWRIGGPARQLALPGDEADLAALLALEETPRLILGGGSNLLVADEGFAGVVVDLALGWGDVAWDAEREEIVAGAGANTRAVAHFARLRGRTGAEFLSGIPGRIGGAVAMNAGAYGGELKDLLVAVTAMDPQGRVQELPAAHLALSYRFANLPREWVVLGARLRLPPGEPGAIRERMRALNRKRRESQPIGLPSAGSTFKNPASGPKAWEWIAAAGCRGMREGAAQVSEKHCNFFLNAGGASAREMRRLIGRVREAVLRINGPVLELEVRLLGPDGVLASEMIG